MTAIRLGRLALADLYLSYKAMLVTLGAIIGVLLVVNVASVFSSNTWGFHEVFFPLGLMIGGHVVTSLAFKGMHNKLTGHAYLVLPGSMLEKYLARLLLTTLGWCLACLGGYLVFSLISAGLTQAVFGMSYGIFNPFSGGVWWWIRLYVITQAVTFVGAIYFRRLHLVKTTLSITVFALGLALLVSLLSLALFWGPVKELIVEGVSGRLQSLDISPTAGDGLERFFAAVGRGASVFFWWIMAPLCWVLGYIRLRETQV